MKLYSALYHDFHPFDKFFPDADKEVVNAKSIMEAPGLLIIHGGSDIHPSLYGRKNEHSSVGHAPSPRDQAEVLLFTQAVQKGIPILGICRGAQLGCAMASGILVQDVDGHGWGHRITTKDGRTMMTTSIHHQMMYPWKTKHELLGWSSIPRSTYYAGVTDEELADWPTTTYESANGETEGLIEPEIVWFPELKCLAVQGHPEMMDAKCDLNNHIKDLINAYCFPVH